MDVLSGAHVGDIAYLSYSLFGSRAMYSYKEVLMAMS